MCHVKLYKAAWHAAEDTSRIMNGMTYEVRGGCRID